MGISDSGDTRKRITEKDLVEAFERVLREDHPNPTREQCPAPSVLQQIAGAPADSILIDHQTLTHIGQCWPCLDDLKRLREGRKGT